METKYAKDDLGYAKDNKEKMPLEYYLDKFKNADPKEISQRLGLAYDEEKQSLTLKFMGTTYHIAYPDFAISFDEDGLPFHILPTNVQAKLVVLIYLMQAQAVPAKGEFYAFRDLPSGELYFRQFQGRCIFRMLRKYGKNPEELKKVMEAIGAAEATGADYAWDFPLIGELVICFMLWEGDEEFPASMQILYSDNFPAAYGTYDLAEITESCINTIQTLQKKL